MHETKLIAKKPGAKKSNNVSIAHKNNSSSRDTSIDQILFLQRTAGNRAVQDLLRSGTLRAKLKISQPGDKYEQEADRMADAVVGIGSLNNKPTTTSLTSLGLQREEKKPSQNEEKLKEGLKKAGEAFLETDVGKKIKEKATELGKDFVSSLEGKIITGTAAVGALAGIIASNSELPMQIPEIPLDILTPGLKVKFTYEGPVQKPTAASITFTFTPGSGSAKKPAMTESEKYRAETARMAADQAKFREGLKSKEQRDAENAAFQRAYWGGLDRFGLRPLSIPGLTKPEDKTLKRKSSGNSWQTDDATPIVDSVIKTGSGKQLDKSTRTLMESRFGQDFSHVRVHTDSRAAESARAVNARAYTVGKDVVFGPGEYAPGILDGQRLLAHELTHVVQQRTQTGSFVSAQILQRVVNYLEQVTGVQANPYLQAFDRTVETIDMQISNTTDPVANDLRLALAQLRSLRTRNKVTCWHISGGLTYASYDNASGEIRLHITFGSRATSVESLIHEGIHALHASRYPRLSRMYADVLAAGGTTNESLGILLLKWKAWTEYWAYRRAVELDNLRQSPEFRRNPDITARQERDVVGSIARVREVTGENFDPANWTPPRERRSR